MKRDLEAEEIAVELVQLRRRYDDVERRHAQVHERVLAFPTAHGVAEERALESQLLSLSATMRLLEANLRTVHPPRLRFMPSHAQ